MNAKSTHTFEKIGENKTGTFEIGDTVKGFFTHPPIVGQSFIFDHDGGDRYRITSVVLNIINHNNGDIFIETLNSVYKLKEISNDED